MRLKTKLISTLEALENLCIITYYTNWKEANSFLLAGILWVGWHFCIHETVQAFAIALVKASPTVRESM